MNLLIDYIESIRVPPYEVDIIFNTETLKFGLLFNKTPQNRSSTVIFPEKQYLISFLKGKISMRETILSVEHVFLFNILTLPEKSFTLKLKTLKYVIPKEFDFLLTPKTLKDSIIINKVLRIITSKNN